MEKLLTLSTLSLLLLMASLLLQGNGEFQTLSDTVKICDNGKDNVTLDIGEESNWVCPANSTIIKHSYMRAPLPSCNISHLDYEPLYVCMDSELTYSDQPPSVGDYRPLPPLYGEYTYLPPQRWLHALRLGAVAFLYHPCTPQDQVDLLKSVARDCLWKHVITPYPNLSQDKPLAVVSWGCVYSMGWVDPPLVREWLTQHALATDQSSDLTNEGYDEGLIKESDHGLPPDTVCPHEASHAPTQTSPSPCTDCTCPDCPTNHTIIAHSNRLTVLLALVIVILILAILLVMWRFYLSCSVKVKTKGRYKSVSKYFPVGGAPREGMAIPEVGFPKHGLAEREKLLDASDEDEL